MVQLCMENYNVFIVWFQYVQRWSIYNLSYRKSYES